MLAGLLLSAAVALTSLEGAAPGQYSDKGLCDLWAGATCHQSSCAKDAKARCDVESRRCRGRTRAAVPPERAEKVAACARAILRSSCGAPAPDECRDVTPP